MPQLMELPQIRKIWERLGDIPVNENEEIDQDFFVKETETFFKKGTDIYEIWGWFEESFDISVANDLMYQKQN